MTGYEEIAPAAATLLGVLVGGLLTVGVIYVAVGWLPFRPFPAVMVATLSQKRPDASDLLIVCGGLLVLGGVYLLLGVAVAMILAGLALAVVGLQAGWKAGG